MCQDRAIHSEEYKGYTINIKPDENGESSREWDNLGTMVCWHSRYTLGDEQPKIQPNQYLANLAMDALTEEEYDYISYGWCDYKLEDKEKAKIEKYLDKHYIMLPLHVYEHGGITMQCSSFSCPWDSGQVGFIYVSKDDIRKEYSWKNITKKRQDQIIKYLEGEVETYDQYLTGQVYGYEVLDSDGEFIDSCYGYFGDYDDPFGALHEAYGLINWNVKDEEKKERELIERALQFA